MTDAGTTATSPQDPSQVIWLTQEAHDKLVEELEELRGPRSQEVVERIAAARDEGDLRENGGYHAAKDEQGQINLRIAQLEGMIRRAQVGETPADDGIVKPGMVVEVRFAGDTATERYLLGAREISADEGLEVLSPQSPMGSALVGRHVGDSVEYAAPNGRTIGVTVVSAHPYTG